MTKDIWTKWYGHCQPQFLVKTFWVKDHLENFSQLAQSAGTAENTDSISAEE